MSLYIQPFPSRQIRPVQPVQFEGKNKQAKKQKRQIETALTQSGVGDPKSDLVTTTGFEPYKIHISTHPDEKPRVVIIAAPIRKQNLDWNGLVKRLEEVLKAFQSIPVIIREGKGCCGKSCSTCVLKNPWK